MKNISKNAFICLMDNRIVLLTNKWMFAKTNNIGQYNWGECIGIRG